MDKPRTMPVKEYLVRIMSVKLNIPAKTIEAIVEHQFEVVHKSMQDPNINTVEVSGFGKFVMNKRKAMHKWNKNLYKKDSNEQKLLAENITESNRTKFSRFVNEAIEWLKYTKPRIDGFPADIRGMEKSPDSTKRNGEEDRSDLPD